MGLQLHLKGFQGTKQRCVAHTRTYTTCPYPQVSGPKLKVKDQGHTFSHPKYIFEGQIYRDRFYSESVGFKFNKMS